MKTENDIQWKIWEHRPNCDAVVRKRFPDYYVLDYAHSGEVYVKVDDGPAEVLQAPVAWWTWPGPYFIFGNVSGQIWEHRYISFRGRGVSSLINAGLFDVSGKTFYRKIGAPGRFASAMDELMDYLDFPEYGNARAVHMLQGLLLQLNEQRADAAPGNPAASRISDLAREIRNRPESNWDFFAESRRLSLSYSHFRALFRDLTGFPPHSYLLRMRCRKAAQYLRRRKMEIKEVADILGFCDVYHFSKAFKKYMKRTPGSCRNESLDG